MNRKKLSEFIRWRFFLLFFATCAVTIVLCMLAVFFLSERYYIFKKTQNIRNACEILNKASETGTVFSEEMAAKMQEISERYSIQLIVLDADSKVEIATTYNVEFLEKRLWSNLLEFGDLMQGEGLRYTVRQGEEDSLGNSYMEAYGFLDNGDVFLMRTAISSIRESSGLAARFILIVGAIAILIGALMAWYSSYWLSVRELEEKNKELEREIAAKEQLDAQRREFISNVSHELKTPIALIQGYAEGLEDLLASPVGQELQAHQKGIDSSGVSACTDGLASPEDLLAMPVGQELQAHQKGIDGLASPEQCDEYLQVIIEEAKRMNATIRQLRALSELEEGVDERIPERFDLTALIQNFLKSSDILTKSENIEVRFAVYPEVYVLADAFRVEEVLQNYFNNALHHVSENGYIEISLDECGDGNVRVNVFNTGKQIEQEILPHIWEKFYKADMSHTRAHGGSGIGLSIVKAIQEQAGEDYGVTNSDTGVTFWFDIREDKEK